MDENHQNKTANKQMATEDKSQLPSFSPQDERDEKEAQEELARLRKRLQKNENVAFKFPHKWKGFHGKTLWDWLRLLLIPLVLTVGGFLFSSYQHDTDQQRALDQQQATILQTYIDNIQDLLLNHNLLKSSSFDTKNPYYDVAMLARARTITALEGLDPARKGRLVQFLYEAHLIGFLENRDEKQLPSIDLYGANLSRADLNGIPLLGVWLRGANLSNATFTCANIGSSGFYIIRCASLAEAELSGADLSYANLSGINLYAADLTANLTNANLSNANLTNASLGANLTNADLRGANLTNADLRDAFLPISDITQQQLDQVSSCKGATLPPGLTCHHNQ